MDIKYLKGVGEKRAEAFAKIGINTLEDFLNFIPRTYISRISIREINKHLDENVMILGEVIDVVYPRKSNHPLQVIIKDKSGAVDIPIFGTSEFRSKQFRLNDRFLFWIKADNDNYSSTAKISYRDHLKLDQYDTLENDFLKFRYFPLYELSGILKKSWIRPMILSKIIFNAFSTLLKNDKDAIEETLPVEILKENNLISRKDAVLRINFPREMADVETARKRLSFEELFYLELILALKKKSIQNEKKGITFIKDIKDLGEKFRNILPYELTAAQKRVINEIYQDMRSDKCMNRLLQGDVGSGKTVVAVFSMLIAIENGYQAAFMCPTELLAEQHFKTISELVKSMDLKVTLLVGGQKKKLREEILYDIREGKTNIIIGTHALIQEKVEFKNLGFVVIDEQHKFGVMQRAKLKEKGFNPDVLVMTATPIPRTLSMTYYGDLDVSVIDELPKNRIPIKTALRTEDDKPKIYKFINDEIQNGRQIYIIYPLIDESEKLDLKSAEENYKLLKENIFPELNVGMVHGKMFWYEKDEVTEEFRKGRINILVSTTVIEVGIDIPNATVMIIEEAQRFGLSQLHQLRGRVGRGADQSYCILVAKNLDEVSMKRLSILCETTDGFKIAEADMEIRGPGEFFGIRQSGVLNFSCTDLNKDKDVLETARKIAFKIIEEDPQLRMPEYKMIKRAFMKNFKNSLYLMEVA
ncbi:MAG TPA: ATP-dependent DNA helicase RecG [Ignavibacteria bacterium]|nr:ATP-dependent DNA helicase RecG [Ignavibacteria bacterium]